MSKLNLQDPEPGIRMRLEIPEIAGLEYGVREIAHAMPLDVEVQCPPKRRRTLCCIVVQRRAAGARRSPIMLDLVEDGLCRLRARFHLRVRTDHEGRARIAFMAFPDHAEIDKK